MTHLFHLLIYKAVARKKWGGGGGTNSCTSGDYASKEVVTFKTVITVMGGGCTHVHSVCYDLPCDIIVSMYNLLHPYTIEFCHKNTYKRLDSNTQKIWFGAGGGGGGGGGNCLPPYNPDLYGVGRQHSKLVIAELDRC